MIFPSCFLSISQSISCLFTHVASSELKSLFKICTSLRASFSGCSGGGAGKGWDLATTCLEFKYLHRQIEKVAAKCWLAEMTLIMASLPLAHVFLMFVYIRARFRFALIGGNLKAQNSRDVAASSPPPSPPCCQSAAESLLPGEIISEVSICT